MITMISLPYIMILEQNLKSWVITRRDRPRRHRARPRRARRVMTGQAKASVRRPIPPPVNPRYTSLMDRDLIGYGANPPNPNWPGAARLAVNFVLNFEEGSEPSIGDGDPASEWGLTEYLGTNPGVKGRDLAAEGMFALRLPRRLLARDAPVRRALPADDHLRLRPGAGAQPSRRRRDQSRRARHLLSRLALGKALRTRRGQPNAPASPAPSPRSKRPWGSVRSAGIAAAGPA